MTKNQGFYLIFCILKATTEENSRIRIRLNGTYPRIRIRAKKLGFLNTDWF